MEITERMPVQVAAVARVLNALKLPPDPLRLCFMPPGKDAYTDQWRTETILAEITALTGSFEGKKLIDIGCGSVNQDTKKTVILEALHSMGIRPAVYVGIDPGISPRHLSETGTGDERTIYLPVSIFQLDEQAMDALGKFDIVFTSMFFGAPVGISSDQMVQGIIDAQPRLPIPEQRKILPELRQIEESYLEMGMFHGGIVRYFLEYLIQEYCRKLIKDNGFVAHYVLHGETAPNIEMTRGAGLELTHTIERRPDSGGHDIYGKIFIFTKETAGSE